VAPRALPQRARARVAWPVYAHARRDPVARCASPFAHARANAHRVSAATRPTQPPATCASPCTRRATGFARQACAQARCGSPGPLGAAGAEPIPFRPTTCSCGTAPRPRTAPA
jgi:hypothetical protein